MEAPTQPALTTNASVHLRRELLSNVGSFQTVHHVLCTSYNTAPLRDSATQGSHAVTRLKVAKVANHKWPGAPEPLCSCPESCATCRAKTCNLDSSTSTSPVRYWHHSKRHPVDHAPKRSYKPCSTQRLVHTYCRGPEYLVSCCAPAQLVAPRSVKQGQHHDQVSSCGYHEEVCMVSSSLRLGTALAAPGCRLSSASR